MTHPRQEPIADPAYAPVYDPELDEIMQQAATTLQRPGPDQIATIRGVVFALNKALSERTMP